MDTGSVNTMRNGKHPEKHQHHYTTNPPTAHNTDPQSLQSYRLSAFSQSSYSTPIPSSSDLSNIEKSHRTKIDGEITAILARFNQ
ncbi:hypothetical protein F4809DRAFT_612154 [Biscogniauxia mediterranea]|nr:hypothetical protein F4809DRAFT_612154 [Biscogniauxia mediterranea]